MKAMIHLASLLLAGHMTQEKYMPLDTRLDTAAAAPAQREAAP